MDKIRHLFIIDIEFDKENSTEKQLFFNEICTTIFEKKGFVCKQRSTFQILDAMRLNDKGIINSYKTIARTHATMDKKVNIPLYAEHIHFLILKCGW